MEFVHFKPWQKLTVTGNCPLVRQGHAVAVVQNRAYLFGGSALSDDSSNIYYDDLYCIKLNDYLQETSWELIKSSGDIPSGREGHSLNVVNSELFMMGGVESEDITCPSNKLYILNTDKHCWSMKTMAGTIPRAQSSTCVSTSDGRLISFGGVLAGKACNDTHIMDIATYEWTCPDTIGNKPLSRCDHGCVVVDKKMYVFGGSGGESLWFNDLSYLNLDTFEWVVLHSIAQSPCPRDYPSLLAVDTKSVKILVVFGGFTGQDGQEVCLGDTHSLCYDSTSSWKLVDDAHPPPGRYGHAAFVYNNKIFIQGGQSIERMFNDLWVLELIPPDISFSPTVPPRRIYNTATPIPTPRKKLPQPSVSDQSITNDRDLNELRSQYVGQINLLFDTLTQKFQELDEMAAKLEAERKQFEEEREELHSTYDRQQKELQDLIDRHKQDNEEWVETLRIQNNQEKKEIAEDKAKLEKEKEDFENERDKFNQKSTKLDEIMKQVQGLK